MVKSKVNMVYENNDQEQYFQLNVTVDAKMDGGTEELTKKLKALDSTFEGYSEDLGDYAGNFTGSVKDSNDSKTEDYNNTMKKYEEKKKKDSDKSDSGIKAQGPGAHVELDFYIGHKKTGSDTSLKWHVYLGQPDPDKRCTFTLIDFNSTIVTVAVGANAYLCVGNELPNNGNLPPIPVKIRNFLNGSSSGTYESDDVSKADKARNEAKTRFMSNATTGGGVMMGAAVWGYIKVNLGLFYGDMGAEAGFDLSIRKLGPERCINLKDGTPGHNGWYGEGQLYAYIYAKFGIRIFLGFFNKKIDLLDAGMGGVLRCGMPNPNYFTGKARVKLRLLGGLVKINKKFSFECGNVCEMFLGNALDNYKLFETCNIGSEDWDKAVENPIDWQIQSRPKVTTQSDINSIINVADPNEVAKLKESSAADNYDEKAIERLASRKFKFEIMADSVPTLTEYSNLKDAKAGKNGKTSEMKYFVNGDKVTLSVTALNPNKYYRLRIKGRAREFVKGKWNHPETFDTITNQWNFRPWTQTKDFFFVTNNTAERTFEDAEDLEQHVALAFPANTDGYKDKNGILISSKSVHVLPIDLKHPIISLKYRMKGKAYNKGNLKWYLYKGTQIVSSANNKWIENDTVSIMTPDGGLELFNVASRYQYGHCRLVLRYEWVERLRSPATWTEYKNYVVYGNSPEEVYKREQSNLLKSLTSTPTPARYTGTGRTGGTGSSRSGRSSSSGTRNVSLNNYRIEVNKIDYATTTDLGESTDASSGGTRYRVTIYKKESAMVDAHQSKDLMDLSNVYLYGNPPDGDKIFDTPTNNTEPYFEAFLGVRLDHMTLNISRQSDKYLIGDFQKSDSKFSVASPGLLTITSNPFTYMSYLSNMFFIGGRYFTSSKNYLNFTCRSTESMYIDTPLGTWNFGLLQKGDYLISDGQVSIREKVTMDRTKIFKTHVRTLWPLYSRGTVYHNNLLGEDTDGLITELPLTERAQAEVFYDLFDVCAKVSDEIGVKVHYQNKYKRGNVKDWMATYAGRIFTTSGRYNRIRLNIPAYQYGVLWGSASYGSLDPNVMFKDPWNSRHFRIFAHPAVGSPSCHLGRRLYLYTATSMDTRFSSSKASEYSNMKFTFTRYRVNAWNYKAMRWTVFRPASCKEIKDNCDYFFKTYTRTYKELIKKL